MQGFLAFMTLGLACLIGAWALVGFAVLFRERTRARTPAVVAAPSA